MLRHLNVKQINILEKLVVGQELATLKYIKLIFLFSWLKNGNDVVSLKDDKDFSHNFTISELPGQDCISGPKNIEPMRFIIKPLSINVLSVRNVHKRLSIEQVVAPMWDVKWEVIIDKNSKRLTISFIVDGALITRVSVIDG